MTGSAIPASLISAYEATDYRVLEPVAFTMKIGRRSPELEDLYRRTGAKTATVITAWNPRSEKKTVAENAAAQARLIADLEAAGLAHLPALGADPKGDWKSEVSLLVLDAMKETVETLGRKYGQNCIVWVEADAVPSLLFCADAVGDRTSVPQSDQD
jgi:hypothetical protein